MDALSLWPQQEVQANKAEDNMTQTGKRKPPLKMATFQEHVSPIMGSYSLAGGEPSPAPLKVMKVSTEQEKDKDQTRQKAGGRRYHWLTEGLR